MVRMKIATWNVNGFRAREAQLTAWMDAESPDVFCLQEIKAEITQLPLALGGFAAYESFFHGSAGYSGVSVHVKKAWAAERPRFSVPAFDFETRIACASVGDHVFASVYVPNGGKDFAAKLTFLRALVAFAESTLREGKKLVVCGDLNVAHRPIDVHGKERREAAIGQRADERALMDELFATGLVDVVRAVHPDDDAFFTWWPYWREARAKNVGWRIDYVLAPTEMASRVTACVSQRDVGASDHAPLVVTVGST